MEISTLFMPWSMFEKQWFIYSPSNRLINSIHIHSKAKGQKDIIIFVDKRTSNNIRHKFTIYTAPFVELPKDMRME